MMRKLLLAWALLAIAVQGLRIHSESFAEGKQSELDGKESATKLLPWQKLMALPLALKPSSSRALTFGPGVSRTGLSHSLSSAVGQGTAVNRTVGRGIGQPGMMMWSGDGRLENEGSVPTTGNSNLDELWAWQQNRDFSRLKVLAFEAIQKERPCKWLSQKELISQMEELMSQEELIPRFEERLERLKSQDRAYPQVISLEQLISQEELISHEGSVFTTGNSELDELLAWQQDRDLSKLTYEALVGMLQSRGVDRREIGSRSVQSKVALITRLETWEQNRLKVRQDLMPRLEQEMEERLENEGSVPTTGNLNLDALLAWQQNRDLSKLKVKESRVQLQHGLSLEAMFKRRGLPVSGKKAALITRLETWEKDDLIPWLRLEQEMRVQFPQLTASNLDRLLAWHRDLSKHKVAVALQRDLSKLKVVALEAMLKRRVLPVSGKKAALITRLETWEQEELNIVTWEKLVALHEEHDFPSKKDLPVLYMDLPEDGGEA